MLLPKRDSFWKSKYSLLNRYDLNECAANSAYLNSYLRPQLFSNQEIIYYKDKPIRSMDYYVNLYIIAFKSLLLKNTLMLSIMKLLDRVWPFFHAKKLLANIFVNKKGKYLKELTFLELFFRIFDSLCIEKKVARCRWNKSKNLLSYLLRPKKR